MTTSVRLPKNICTDRSFYSPGRPREVVAGEKRLSGLTSPSSTEAMKVGLSEKRSITPQKAIEVLKKPGSRKIQQKARTNDVLRTAHQEKTQKKSKITVERAIEMLGKRGLSVTQEQASEIIELLKALAKVEIDNYLKHENS